MNTFDSWGIHLLNSYAHKSGTFDQAIQLVATLYLFKSGIALVLLWWVWFRRRDDKVRDREVVVGTIAACALGLTVGRILQVTLPFRIRPLQNVDLHFQLPYGMSPTVLESWSSFPSDHAVYFLALAASFFFISRYLGAFLVVYMSVIVLIPRVYLGLHYPTDIIGGALIGIIAAYITNLPRLRKMMTQPVLRWLEKWPGLFYAFAFLVTWQMATLFDELRLIGAFSLSALKRVIQLIH